MNLEFESRTKRKEPEPEPEPEPEDNVQNNAGLDINWFLDIVRNILHVHVCIYVYYTAEIQKTAVNLVNHRDAYMAEY